MVKAYSYLRYSSPAQARGDSARRQLTASVQWAEKHGLELDTSLRDLGVSGFTGLHRIKGALASFLARVDSGEIEAGSYLLVDSMDRLSRESEGEVLHLLTGLTRRGIKVVNVSEDHVLDDKAEMVDYMRVLIHAARSHQESKEKGRKVAEAHAESKRRAREEGRVWHSSGPTWLRRQGEAWVILPEKRRIVQKAFDLREAGMGTTAIAIRMNEEGEPTPKERGTWHHSTVLEMLKNRAVLGEYQPKFAKGNIRGSRRPPDGDPIAGYYPPIIAQDQFYRVQALIAAERPKGGRRPNTVQVSNLFAGIGKCRLCGGTVGLHGSGQRWSKPVLRCNAGARKLCSNHRRYRYDLVEAAILHHVADFDLTLGPAVRDPAEDSLGAAQGRLAELENQISILLDRIERGEGDDLVEARYAKRRSEWAALKDEIAKLERGMTFARVRPAPAIRLEQVENLKKAMGAKEGRALYDVRIRLAAAIRDVVTTVQFGEDGWFWVKVLDGFSEYAFRDFCLVHEARGTAELLASPKYGRRFHKNDATRRAKAERALRNLGG